MGGAAPASRPGCRNPLALLCPSNDDHLPVKLPRRPARPPLIALLPLLALLAAALACSADDVIGQRPPLITPTSAVFATATPGGRVSVLIGTPGVLPSPVAGDGSVPIGQVVGPAATATAAYATRAAATSTAAAAVAPIFQPGECPPPGAPVPPLRPATFGLFPQAIGLFLSAGGPTTTLESLLRSWGAINEGRGVVQSDTDLTGDGLPEIIVTIADPTAYRADAPSPGQLLIYGCAQRAYRLLYSTPYSGGTMLPELKRVGNMNGGGRAQIVFAQQVCSVACTQAAQILQWNTTIGAFTPLNDRPIEATGAKVQIGDVDGDGLLEVTVTFNPPADPNAGPYRRIVHIWDWNGVSYVLGQVQEDAPTYRIHALYDADAVFFSGDFRGAVRAYDRIINDQNLAPWYPSDPTVLRAMANFRKLTAYAALRQSKAVEDTVNTINTENPPGSPAEAWGAIASSFLENYRKFRSLSRVCAAVIPVITSRPDLFATINQYGAANHTYTAGELCPF